MISELLYAGKSLQEIAGYDDIQLRGVLFRKRDKDGKLSSLNDLPDGVEVDEDGMRVVSNPAPYAEMYKSIAKRQGKDEVKCWNEFIAANPKFGRGGE